jgi:hypothetical protein
MYPEENLKFHLSNNFLKAISQVNSSLPELTILAYNQITFLPGVRAGLCVLMVKR